jgi:hypothetical protein
MPRVSGDLGKAAGPVMAIAGTSGPVVGNVDVNLDLVAIKFDFMYPSLAASAGAMKPGSGAPVPNAGGLARGWAMIRPGASAGGARCPGSALRVDRRNLASKMGRRAAAGRSVRNSLATSADTSWDQPSVLKETTLNGF